LSALIQDLKNEHEVIFSALNEVINKGINTKEGQLKLVEVKDALISHLQKEDELIYPYLKEVAETNEKAKSILEKYAQEMKKISDIAFEFFEKYSSGGSGLDFAREFGKLYGTLGKRIKKEESVLYKLYEEIKL